MTATPEVAVSVLDCRVFSELSVATGGRQADLGGPKQRLLLAVLLSRANTIVGVDELTETLWDGAPPRSARKNLQVYVSKLRKAFGDRLTHVGPGYRLRVGPGECDLQRFDHLVRSGRRHVLDGDFAIGAELLGEAVMAWQRPFAEFPRLADEADRREERFLDALEEWAELVAERGGHRLVLERLAPHVRPHVLRERLGAAWLHALAAAGRGSEALAHYDLVRRALADELGVDPGPALTAAHRALLAVAPRTALGTQLPRDLPDFVGRGAEVRQVVDEFSGSRGHDVVVVTGPVGAGKSAFAVHTAHLLADAFPDGRFLLDLRAPDGTAKPAATVLAELLELLGLGAVPSARRALAVWRTWVADRRMLVVLDNAVGEDVVRALLPGGASATIVTSSQRLSGLEGVCRVELPPFTAAESTELLGRIIGHGRVLADPGAARGILRHCEGSPLAVRLTAARLDALRHVRLADHLDRLAATRRLPDEMSAGGTSLRKHYEVFHHGLTPLQRAAYRRVAALPGPHSHARVLAALGELGEPGLEALFECHLLTTPDCEVTAHSADYTLSALAAQACPE
ncbi:BTAD domain-containing putative transcriptional regulator [Amycolatopsis sp. NPDC049253]|uniref:AfsR/SARP family transcriptional regulator n=1 Tax=Amycolatopsis sp. NPDC049253 TaxID=3155274 RepID=UPI00342F696F